jgi:hypothetical protein
MSSGLASDFLTMRCRRSATQQDVEAPVMITSAERSSFAPIAQRAAHDAPPANTTSATSARR